MKPVKVYIFIIMIFCGFSANAQDYWLRQPSPTAALLYRCAFTDTLNGWAVGDSGRIIHTSDGGNTWNLQNSTINFSIEDVFFLNPRLGWALANDHYNYGTMVIKTANGGVNWTASRYPDSTFELYSVYYLDSLNGYMGGNNGVILKTTNAGNSWIMAVIDSNTTSHFPIWNISFRNSQYGLACGGLMEYGGILWKTTDYGYSWKSRPIAPEPFFDSKWIDSLRIIFAGGDYDVGGHTSSTSNGGEDWNFKPTGVWGVGRAIAFRTPSEAWIPHSYSLRWALSTDSAKTWSEVLVPDTSGIYDAQFIDSLHGWAVGENGSVYKFNSSLIGVNNISDNLPWGFQLFQNYPNPFNPKTVISYELSRGAGTGGVTSYIQLSVYNVQGKLISDIINHKQSEGRYKIEWNAENLPSGVYFYQLIISNEQSTIVYSKTRKMVLIK